MAKVKKFSEDNSITVTPDSKSTTWQYTGTTSYIFTITNKVSEGYNPEYRSFAVRSKNDIVVTTMFATNTGKVKKVTNTIKNYFADPNAEYQIKYSHYMNASDVWHTVSPGTKAGYSGLFGTVEDAEYYLASSDKSAPFVTFSADQNTEVLDLKGNDNYKTDHDTNKTDYFYELAGNDYYETESGGIMQVNDYSGKDQYKIWSKGSFLNAYDYKGNDKYTLMGCTGFVINDYAGNDDYRPSNNDADADKIINDFKGNDKYQVEDTSFAIEDKVGKDNYQIYESKVDINDMGKGNDTYGIYGCFDMTYANNDFVIENEKGNETYNITGLTFSDNYGDNYAIKDLSGNDKYNFKNGESRKVNVNTVQILDEKGKDKYNFTVSDSTGKINNVRIYDNGGADSYTVAGHEDSYIENINIFDESKSKDKYNFSKVNGFHIYDDEGNDTYKLLDCKKGNAYDDAGNDKYTVSPAANSQITIVDEGKGKDSYTVDISKENNSSAFIMDDGGKDSLTLSGLKKYNLIFMADIKNDKTFWTNSIMVYNKVNRSFIYISDFYDVKDNAITGFGDGRIETVKAGKTTLKDIQSDALYQDFNSLREEVGKWITSTGNRSVYDVLNSGTDYQKDCLVALFTHSDLPKNPVT